MVDYGVEGLLDNKIKDSHNLKGKQQNSFIIHTIAIIVLSNTIVVMVKEFIKMLN
jgi:hypothetical protein